MRDTVVGGSHVLFCLRCSFIERIVKLPGGDLLIGDLKQFHTDLLLQASKTRVGGRKEKLKNVKHREGAVIQKEEKSAHFLPKYSHKGHSHPWASPV